MRALAFVTIVQKPKKEFDMPATKPNIAALVEQMPDTDKEIQAKQEEAKQRLSPALLTSPNPGPIAGAPPASSPDLTR
jgi:hypothetical protein